MRPDVDELQAFYGTRQGQLARRLIASRIKALWPDVAGTRVLGLGYAAPFLHLFDAADRAVAFMPASQGACGWPGDGPSRAALVREEELPLPDGCVDRVLLVHAIECSPAPSRLLREVWRVLADGGRLLVLVPNRTGLWCLSERTPFGHGQPYSQRQLAATLGRHLFEPTGDGRALYLWPTSSRLLLRTAIPIERLGLRLARELSGVVMVEAEKRIYLGNPVAAARRAGTRQYRPVVEGIAAARDLAQSSPAGARRNVVWLRPLSPGEPR